MKALSSILIVVAFSLFACSSLHTPLPLTEVPPPAALSLSVFVGHGHAFFGSKFLDEVAELHQNRVVAAIGHRRARHCEGWRTDAVPGPYSRQRLPVTIGPAASFRPGKGHEGGPGGSPLAGRHDKFAQERARQPVRQNGSTTANAAKARGAG